MRFQPLEKLINLREGYIGKYRIDDLEILLIERAGERYLIEARCPHREHPLDMGTITDSTIQCALHRYTFTLRDGSLLASTEEPCRGLRVYEAVYQGSDIGLMLPE